MEISERSKEISVKQSERRPTELRKASLTCTPDVLAQTIQDFSQQNADWIDAMLFVCNHACESQDGLFYTQRASKVFPTEKICPVVKILQKWGETPRCQK